MENVKKSFVRRNGLLNIYTEEFIKENPDCLYVPDKYHYLFIVGRIPSKEILRIVFGDILSIDYYLKEGEEWKKLDIPPKTISYEGVRDGKMKVVTNWDEAKLIKDLEEEIKVLPENSDIYDVLVSSGLFKSRTAVKNNWKLSKREVECGITELLNVGKLRENILIYRDYPD